MINRKRLLAVLPAGIATALMLTSVATAAPRSKGVYARPSSVKFQPTTVNVITSKNVSLINSTTSPVTVTQISTSNYVFAISFGTCPTTLDAGTSCTLDLRFETSVPGTYSGTASINYTGGQLDIPLTGTAR